MSKLDKFVDVYGSATPVEILVQFGSSSSPVVEHSSLLFSAEFGRDGTDLVLSNFGQPDIRIVNYFKGDTPADIHTKDGKVLAGDVAEKLAGPEFPAQYAQVGTASGTDAIGQVETISGEVTVQRASGVREALSLGAKVFANDVVQTGGGGALSLTFVDGTIFTLAESSRMVLDSLIYDPASSQNSGIFNLVEGSFVFIAGEVAKTGGMDVKTPAATMGIRGTTVIVKIETINGETQVEVSLNEDPDGGLGQFTITGLDGAEIASVDGIATKWLISPVEGQTREIIRTPEELGVDQSFQAQAVGAYRVANQRVADGGEFVETDGGGTETPQNPDGDPNVAPPDTPDEPTDEIPENETEDDDQRGQLGSGIKTELAIDTSQPELLTDTVVISRLNSSGEVLSIGSFDAQNDVVLSSDEQLLEPNPVEPLETKRAGSDPVEARDAEPLLQPVNLAPEIEPPAVGAEVQEDGSVVLNGFNFSDPENDVLTATITAGSTLTLATGSGVTILQGTGINEEVTIIRGTGEQISNALNGAVYMPTPDADGSGSLTVELSDGELSTTYQTTITISPTQDAPVALPDALDAGQDDQGLTGNLLANDYDVDTNPTPDELTVVSVNVDGVDYGLTGGVVSVSLASGAQITVNQNGSYVFNTNNAYGALNGGEITIETIGYTLSDDHEADHGGKTTGQLKVSITGVDDSPIVSGDGQIVVEPGEIITLSQADLHTQDLDTSASSIVYTVTSNPSLGQLELSGAPGQQITSFTQQHVDDGELVYVHTGSEVGEDNFSFTVSDGRATVGGGVDVAITQINQDPSGSGLPISLTIDEDSTNLIDLRNLILSDPDAGIAPATLTFEAENASLHALSSPEVTVTITATGLTIEGSLAQLVAAFGDPNFLAITPDEDVFGIGAASVKVSISDNGNTGIGGGDDVEIGTILVNVTPVNDAPVLTIEDQETGYVENDADTIITTAIIIDDPDDTHIESAEVRISENFQAGDNLKFLDTSTITGAYDTATGILTLTGSDTLENYVTALKSVTYSHTTDDISATVRTISYAVNDGESESYLANATVLPTAVNDAPVLTDFPVEFHVDEDVTENINFYDILPIGETFSDLDAGDNQVTFTFTLSGGVLTLPPGGTSVAIDGYELTGTVSAINNYLNNGGTDGTFVRFTTDENSTEDVSLILTVNDLGNSGTGGPKSDSVELEIVVHPVDDPAVVTLSLDTNSYTENDAPVLVDDNVTISDVDSANLISATVEISTNYQAESDILAFTNTANISGSFDIGTGILTLNGTDTLAAYEAALSSVTFENVSDNPTTEARAIVFNVNDGLGNGFSDTITMTVTPSNDAPVLTATAETTSYTEDDPATTIATAIAINDPDYGDLISQATVSISRNFEVGDALGFSNTTNITGSYDAATGILTLAGNDTAANYKTALESISFSSTSQNPSELQRDITYQVADIDGALSDVEIGANVEPTVVNDAPNIATLSEFDVTEDVAGALTFSGAIISDPDAEDSEVSLTLTVDSGTLTFPTGTGITISGNTLSGSIADINQYLAHGGAEGDSMTYAPELNNTAPVTLTLIVDDQGNNGGSALTDTATTTINIDPVNDAPVLTEIPAEFHVDEDVTENINFYDILPIGETFSDLDAGDNLVTFTFTLSGGVLTLPPGGTAVAIDGYELTGTVSAINNYLNNGGTDGTFVRFTTDENSTEDVSLILTVNDLGNSGTGGPKSDSVELEIVVHPVDDPAEVTLSLDTNSYTEGNPAIIIDSEVSINDVDSTSLTRAGVAITANFQAGSDVLAFTNTANITGSYDATTGVLILSGTDTIAAYEAALSAVTYHNSSGNPDTADRTIVFNVDDGAGFGVSDSVTVSINAGNEAPDIIPDSIAASAEHVWNGGFQDGIFFAESDNIYSSGNMNITGWTVSDDNVQYLQETSAGDDGERNRTVSLNGDEPGAISTMIDATIGQQYELSFQGFGDGTLDVVATGGTTESYTFVSDSSGKYHSYEFTATAVMTTLTFTSTTAGEAGPTLDDVTVRKVVGDTFDVVEDTPIEISDIQITDADADAESPFTATFSSSYGLLTINENVQGGISFAQISGNGTYSVTLTGQLSQINETLAAVDGVTYTPNLDFVGEDTIEVHVNDGHATDPQTGTETISLILQPVDDAPAISSDVGDVVAGSVANLTGTQFVGFDGALVGQSVSNVGDINNDGIDDFAIGATASSADGASAPMLTGSVYVIYGIEGTNPYAAYANDDGEVDLDSMAVDGTAFELVGAASGDRAGFSVSGGGDLNNDGISDIVVGAHFVDSPLNSGTAYVVYGGQEFEGLNDGENGEILLSGLGIPGAGNLNGFKFNHINSNAELSYDVSLTGDLNNDGISDLVVSSLSGTTVADSGAWVLFGGQDFSLATSSTTGAFDIGYVGSLVDGFVLQGEAAVDDAGVSIDVVSDFNGDGIDDLLVGAPGEASGGSQSGATYLIYGGQDWESLKLDPFSPAISLTQLGLASGDLQGFKIQSNLEGQSLGLSVSSAGDVDGDGIGDLLATAPGNSSIYTTSSTYLIYGGQNLSGTISTSLIGSAGTGAISGAVFTERPDAEYLSHATALGDIDGDGYSDILIGSQSVGDGSGGSLGHSYIIFGSSAPSSGTYSLEEVGNTIDGFKITGEDSSTQYGQQAQSVGDVNSDGYNDFIVTDLSNDDGGSGAGAAYLVYGSDFNNRVGLVAGADELIGSAGRNIIHGTSGDDVINGGGGGDIITTGAGDDTITIGDSFIDFIDAGAGNDTLKFGDAGSFDLTNINDLRLQSIEALDTVNGVVNDVTLGITDIFQISDDANIELESDLDLVLPTSFLIDADANDTYTFENGSAGGVWTLNTSLSTRLPDYDVYEYVESGSSDVLATLAIDDDVTPTIV